MKNTRSIIPQLIRYCLLAAFVIAFIAGTIMTAKIILEQKTAADAYNAIRLNIQETPAMRNEETEIAALEEIPQPVITMDFTPLKEINAEIVAWLSADGTNIDYPVLHTDNNSYYLNHLYTEEVNSSGSLFVDYRNTGLFTDRNTVIYGHNMKNNTMFNALESYKKQGFYDEHPTMQLYTPDGDYLIELICGTVEDGNYEFVKLDFTDEDVFTEYVESHRSRSTFQSKVELQPGDRIISLCTCSYEWSNARYMVIGRLTPIMKY